MTFFTTLAQGCLVQYSDAEVPDPSFGHLFCGVHKTPGAWCPNCNKPLLRFLRFDIADPRLTLQELKLASLPLFYCWTCDISQGPFSYQLLEDGAISILEYTKSEIEANFPYENYPVFFPEARVILRSLSAKEQAALVSINTQGQKLSSLRKNYPDLFGCRHQIGGEPFLIQRNPDYQDERPVLCPLCHQTMPFFAAIADDCLDDRGFVDNSGVQVLYHLCRACRTVSAFQQCD